MRITSMGRRTSDVIVVFVGARRSIERVIVVSLRL